MLRDLLILFQLGIRQIRQSYTHYQLRRRGIQVAPTAVIVGKCEIHGRVTIGAETVVLASILDGRGGLTIGRNVILNEATIITAQHDLDSPLFETVYAPVEVGDYAAIFTRALVLPGRRIGRGAVVAAGAVVSRDVPDMAVVAGNPAKIVRQRKAVHSELDLRRNVGFVGHRLGEILRKRMRDFRSKLDKAP
jgi:serine acetyltransferase